MDGVTMDPLTDHRKDLSTAERQVEALESIADALGRICAELVQMRAAVAPAPYQRPG